MIAWWKRESGYGAYGRIPNGVLVCAILWTVAAAPFGIAYLLGLEARDAVCRRRKP